MNTPFQKGHVRVGNALRVEPPPEGFIRIGNAFMELRSLEADRDAEYTWLDEEFKEFEDVFSLRQSDKLPHSDALALQSCPWTLQGQFRPY